MATLYNLGNVRRVVVDPVRPRGQSKSWPGWSTGKRIGVTRTVVAACVVSCGGVAIPVAKEAEAVKPTFSVACGMLANVSTWRRKLRHTKHASRTYKSLRRCAVEPRGVLRVTPCGSERGRRKPGGCMSAVKGCSVSPCWCTQPQTIGVLAYSTKSLYILLEGLVVLFRCCIQCVVV